MVSAPSNVDLALDDIIKKTKPGRGRGGRGRGRGAGGNSRGVSKRGGAGGFKSQGQNRGRGGARGSFAGGRGSFGGRGNFGGQSRGFGRPMNYAGQAQGTTKLNISNLEFGVSDNDLKELFQEFGVVRNSAIHYDASGRSLGTAHVIFTNSRSAQSALQKYNGVHLDGRPMRISMEGSRTANVGGARNNAVKRLGGGPSFKGTGATRGNARGGSRGGRGRGGRGGAKGGRGGAKTPKATPTAADLDAELEAYSKEVSK